MKAQSFFYVLPVAAGILCSAVAEDNGVTRNPNKAGDGVQVGVGNRDGVTVSGGEAFVTRNGATEKLVKDLILPSGVIAQPDGTIVLKDGTKVTLKSTQVLTMDGKIVEVLDINETPAPRVTTRRSTSDSTTEQSAMPSNAAVAVGTTRSARTPRNQVAGGSVFIDGSGTPFMGSLTADGSIVTSDGRKIAFDGSVRAVTFAANGTPALAQVNANGTITQADGSILFSDGSVRTADGQVILPPRDAQGNPIRAGVPQNTTNMPLTDAQGRPLNTNAQTGNQNGPATNNNNTTGTNANAGNAGAVRNSPNNTGTVNNPNATDNTATSPNGTTNTRNNSTDSPAAGSGARPSGARNGGSGTGAGTGSGTSGSGGASGGGGGGATR